MTGSNPDESLLAALEAAKRRETWTQELVQQYSVRPATVKADTDACRGCPHPCEDDEVCATVIARGSELIDEAGRNQAFHHVESGMSRVQTIGRGSMRSEDGDRPNTFLSLSETERSDE